MFTKGDYVTNDFHGGVYRVLSVEGDTFNLIRYTKPLTVSRWQVEDRWERAADFQVEEYLNPTPPKPTKASVKTKAFVVDGVTVDSEYDGWLDYDPIVFGERSRPFQWDDQSAGLVGWITRTGYIIKPKEAQLERTTEGGVNYHVSFANHKFEFPNLDVHLQEFFDRAKTVGGKVVARKTRKVSINSNTWHETLVNLGFKIGKENRGKQDTNLIRSNVPEPFQAAFDLGMKGEIPAEMVCA
jgi:hypothetical protein